MKKFHLRNKNFAGPYYGAKYKKVLEDIVHYEYDLCGNTLKKRIIDSSYSNMCFSKN